MTEAEWLGHDAHGLRGLSYEQLMGDLRLFCRTWLSGDCVGCGEPEEAFCRPHCPLTPIYADLCAEIVDPYDWPILLVTIDIVPPKPWTRYEISSLRGGFRR